MWEEEQPVEVGDDTPPIKEQAAAKGWLGDIWDFGRAESPGQIEHFNPGLVRRADGLWLIVRRSEIKSGMPYGHNRIWACQLQDDDHRRVIGGPTLVVPDSGPEEQFEDPRAVYWNGQTWVGMVNFTWFPNGTWTGAHQCIGIFGNDPLWNPIARRDPPIGTNTAARGNTHGKHNKNLLWWFIDDRLHCLYTSDPWVVVEFGSQWTEQKQYANEGVRWKYGWVRGGTPPVLVGDLYYTFFHSSMPWRGRYRRYYMGAIAFNSTPPFMPAFWTQEPLLIGSQNDPWQQRKPLVVFPCGAVYEKERWLISMGINDLKCGWLELPHIELLRLLNPIAITPGMSLLSEHTQHPSVEPIPFTNKPDEGPEAHKTASEPEVPQVVPLAPAVTAIPGDQYWSDLRPPAETPLPPPTISSGEPVFNAPNLKLEAQRERMANARRIMLEKRAAGTLATRKRKLRKRKRKKLT